MGTTCIRYFAENAGKRPFFTILGVIRNKNHSKCYSLYYQD